MSTEEGSGKKLSSQGTSRDPVEATKSGGDSQQQEHRSQLSLPAVPSSIRHEEGQPSEVQETAQSAALTEGPDYDASGGRDEPGTTAAATTTTTTPGGAENISTRQVIAVSASKGPAAFFNLARKFLVTDEMCDLSALEGAIVAAVDAAHLLERSQLATIVRVHTSYVTVEPKRRKQSITASEQEGQPSQPTPDTPAPEQAAVSSTAAASSAPASTAAAAPAPPPTKGTQAHDTAAHQQQEAAEPEPVATQSSKQSGQKGSSERRELRRARIVITVKRTESYKRWLEENPLQAIIASDADDTVLEQAAGSRKQTE